MAFGYDCIPNPLEAEIKNLKKKYESQILEIDQKSLILKNRIAEEVFDRRFNQRA